MHAISAVPSAISQCMRALNRTGMGRNGQETAQLFRSLFARYATPAYTQGLTSHFASKWNSYTSTRKLALGLGGGATVASTIFAARTIHNSNPFFRKISKMRDNGEVINYYKEVEELSLKEINETIKYLLNNNFIDSYYKDNYENHCLMSNLYLRKKIIIVNELDSAVRSKDVKALKTTVHQNFDYLYSGERDIIKELIREVFFGICSWNLEIAEVLVTLEKNICEEDQYLPSLYEVLSDSLGGLNSCEQALLLLKVGADPNIVCKDGQTPLHLATKHYLRYKRPECKSKFFELIAELIANGANINHSDKKGNTPFTLALDEESGGSFPIVEHFLKNGANLNVSDGYFYSPMVNAAISKDEPRLKLFVKNRGSIKKTLKELEKLIVKCEKSGDTSYMEYYINTYTWLAENFPFKRLSLSKPIK